MGSIKTDTIRGVKWSALASFGNTAISFILGVILARLLNPSDYGIVGMTAIFFGIAGVFIDSGFSAALIRKKDLTDVDSSTVFYFNIGASFTIFCILYVASPHIANFLNAPILTDIVKVTAFSMVIGTLGSVQYSLMSKKLEFKTPTIIGLCAHIISGIIGISLAYRGFGPWALVYQSLSSTILKTSAIWFFSKWRPLKRFSKKSFKELFSFGGNLAINSILDRFYNEGTGMMIGKFYSPASLGYYTKGQGLSKYPSTFLFNIVGGVTYPILSKIQDDESKLIYVYSKYIKVLSLVIFFASFLLIALAKPIVSFLYTDKWLPSVIFLQIFTMRYMLYHINAINWNLLLVKGRSDVALKKEIFNKTINFSLLIASIPYGPVKICCAIFLGSVVGIITNTIVSGKLFDFGFKKQVGDFLPYLVKAMICCVPTYGLTFLDLPNIICILVGIFVSSTLYFGYLWISKDENLFELVKLTPLKKYII